MTRLGYRKQEKYPHPVIRLVFHRACFSLLKSRRKKSRSFVVCRRRTSISCARNQWFWRYNLSSVFNASPRHPQVTGAPVDPDNYSERISDEKDSVHNWCFVLRNNAPGPHFSCLSSSSTERQANSDHSCNTKRRRVCAWSSAGEISLERRLGPRTADRCGVGRERRWRTSRYGSAGAESSGAS